MRARFTRVASGIEQEYYARRGETWIRVALALRPGSPRPDGTAPLFSDRGVDIEKRLLVANSLQEMRVDRNHDDRVSVRLSGVNSTAAFEQVVSLNADANHFQIEVKNRLADNPPRIEYLLSTFLFESEKLDYTHAPCMKREAADVIGGRVFHSPAVIFQSDSLVAALVPDLDLLKRHVVFAPEARPIDGSRQFRIFQPRDTISMPAILDIDLQSGLTAKPVFSYGFADYLTQQHMYWKHENSGGAFVRTLSTNELRYGFDLFVSGQAEKGSGYQAVSRHMWARYGSRYIREPKPQAMPFTEYAAVCYPAAFQYHGDTPRDTKRYSERKPYDPQASGSLPTWLEFEIDAHPAGGVRATPSQWYYDIQFMGWWNNLHLAQGMNYWGRQRKDQSLVEKARRIITLAVSAPQNNGIFPVVYNYKDRRWLGCYWKMDSTYNPSVLPKYWDFSSEYYQTCSASKTAALLLRYDKHYEPDARIVPFVPYAEFIAAHLDGNGCLPSWFTSELNAVPYLRVNAEGGVHITFLAELCAATGDKKQLKAAQRMAEFLLANILPQLRWYDFETFYSCASKPEATYDQRTGQWPRCTLSMIWAVDGLTALYECTGDTRILAAAERIADYLCLYQSVWQPPFIITAYAFGGFISQNSDAEWLDMRRQCLCGEALVRIGVATGRQDFLERGVAALRSAFSLINHPRRIANRIFPTPSYPLGITAENIDHEGLPQLPLRSGSDWGEGGALASAAEVLRCIGGMYLNLDKNTAVGVDGVSVKSFRRVGQRLEIELDNLLADLKVPWEDPFPVELLIAGLPVGNYQLSVNTGPQIAISIKGGTRVPLVSSPAIVRIRLSEFVGTLRPCNVRVTLPYPSFSLGFQGVRPRGLNELVD